MAFNVANLAGMLSGVLPALNPVVTEIEAATRSSPQTIANVQSALTGVQQGLAALAQADSMTAAGPILQRIETDATAILTVASQTPLPGVAGMALRIAAMVVPVAFMAVTMIINSQQAASPAATPSAQARQQHR